MKKLNKIVLVLCILGLGSQSFAQQSANMWSWSQNLYSISPAFIGINEGVEVSAFYTNHFTKMPNSARSMGVMASGKLPNEKAGIGINLSREIVGFENVFNGVLSYNYGIPLSKEIELKMGLSLGLIHQNFNTNGLYYHDMEESTIAAINNNPERSAFDANIGLAIVNKNYYLGLSTNRFFKNELEYEANNKEYGFLYQQRINAVAGYTFQELAKDIDLNLNFLLGYQKSTPTFAMTNIQATYLDKYWIGMGYGSDNLVSVHAGLAINELAKVHYLYHAGSLSNQYQLGGGHEIMFTATLGNTKPKVIEKVKIVNQDVIIHDTIVVLKTDTIIKEIKVIKPKEKIQEDSLKSKKDLKRDAENNIIVDELIPLKNEKIDTSKIVFKDVSDQTHPRGHYVVIGSFDVQSNADNLLKTMLVNGEQAFKFQDPSNKRYYIYIFFSTIETEAKKVQLANPKYEGIWVKTIE